MIKALIASAAAALLIGGGAARAADLIANGGFEDGTFIDTQYGSSYSNVPVDWNPGPSFEYGGGDTNGTSGYGTPHSGSYDLSIGNYDYQNSPAVLSQTFTDQAGASYAGSFYVYYGQTDANAFLNASIDGTALVSLDDSIGGTYVEETFNFVGTGKDTLTFTAQTNPAEWVVDDVAVQGAVAVSAAPEPSIWVLMIAGVGLMGAALRRRGRQSMLTAAC